MRHYPNFIEAFMEYTKYVEAPEKFLRWSVISVIAGALERKVWINFKDQLACYPNHFICLIGDPGLTKKSSSSRQATGLLQEVEPVSFCGTQMTTAGLIDELREVGSSKKFDYLGKVYSNSSVYIYSSEAAVTLKGDMQNMLIQNLTDLYDCGPEGWNTKAAWTKRLKNEETKIFNPCINLLACSTPIWLVDSIGKDNLDSGFASRIIFVVQKGTPERDFGWQKVPSMRGMKPKLIEDLTEIAFLQGEFSVTPEFKETFDLIDRDNKIFLLANPGHLMTGYYARKPWHILKLSQVLSASKSNSMQLDSEDLLEARKVVEGLEKDMLGAFSSATMTESSKLLARVWNKVRTSTKVKQSGSVTMTEIKRWFYSEEPSELAKAVSQLQNAKKFGAPNMIERKITYLIEDFSALS